MSYEVFSIPAFDNAAKRLQKKYRHIKADLGRLVDILQDAPFAGVAIPGYGHQVWKIRLASTDMQVGKRGGYRVIYAVDREEGACYLLTIYPKSEKADVSGEELEPLLEDLEQFLDEENAET